MKTTSGVVSHVVTQETTPEVVSEPERYELSEPARYHFEPLRLDVDRRDFLKIFGVMGGGLIVAASLPVQAQQESGRGGGGQASSDLQAWIHIDEKGRVTAFTGKVEIGQNARTSLSQVVADELRVPMSSISFVMADTDLTPYDQGTFGSQTTPRMAPLVARAAATAREMLIDLAAARWQADRSALRAETGQIRASDGRALGYGELTAGRQLAGRVTAEAVGRDRWTVRGTAEPKVNGRDIVLGRHLFTPDVSRPNLMFGQVIRPPAYGSKPQKVDQNEARIIPGLTVVHDGDFIGVVGTSERVVRRGVSALKVEWTPPPEQPTSENVYAHFRKTATTTAGRGGAPPGTAGRGVTAPPAPAAPNLASARASSAHVVDAAYEIPYIAHVPLEPRTAIAEWTDGKVTVWTGTQRPFGVRSEVATAFGIPEDRVRIIVPDMGSGYGGKHSGEQAIEAARLARTAGKPVRLVYRRDEEFMWGYFRPGGVIDVKAGVDAKGKLTFWEFENFNSGNSGLPTPYAVAAQRVAFRQTDSPLRQGSYRGLAATANHYAREMHMDALARAAGIDPVAFRIANLNNDRIRAVLEAAATKIGWPNPSEKDRSLGIACGTEKGSYVGTAAEVMRTADGFAVTRIVVTFECGAIVNPDGLRNQVEGSIVQGLGGALFEAIRFAGGKLLNGTMAEYRVPRFKDVPPLEVLLLDRRDLPSAGAGETPIVCVAPAIGSAVRGLGDVLPKLPVTLKKA
jgi:isoquinoline 1-oxidoreductase